MDDMFVGHYGVALAFRKPARGISLGWLFLAVQGLDLLWAILVLLGIEKFGIIPGLMEASSVDLYFMPYTHSLPAAAALSLLAAFLTWLVSRNLPGALCICAAVFSHWPLDAVVHRHDLPLWDNHAKVGFGLWHSAARTFLLEALLLLAGLRFYLRFSKPVTRMGNFAMPLLVVLLVALNYFNLYGPAPQPGQEKLFAIEAEAAYFVFAALAWWLDRTRTFAA